MDRKKVDYYYCAGVIRELKSDLNRLMNGKDGYLCKLIDAANKLEGVVATDDLVAGIARDISQAHDELEELLSRLHNYCTEEMVK